MTERPPGWIESGMMASSVALVVLLPIEIVSWLIVSDPASHAVPWVVDRWSSSIWRAVDWAFLVVALAHGVGGTVRWLMSDRPVRAWRRVVAELLGAVGLAVVVLASYTFFTFELT